jgi:hypothetical protein
MVRERRSFGGADAEATPKYSTMPLYPDAEAKVKANLQTSAAGGRAALVAIGTFTQRQWDDINAVRRGLGLHELGAGKSFSSGGTSTPAGPMTVTPLTTCGRRSRPRFRPRPWCSPIRK